MLFQTGVIVLTPGIQEKIMQKELTNDDVASCIRRHMVGDWGELDEHDKRQNAEALKHGYRIMSAYTVRGIKVWIITEANRAVTTVLLPEEY